MTPTCAVVSFALLAVLAQGFEQAQVVPNVLDEADISRLHNQVGAVRRLGQFSNVLHSEVTLSPSAVASILASRGDFASVTEPASLQVTLLTGSTEPHIDRKLDATDFEHDEEVIVVFLNDNDDAYYQIGQEKIPVSAGTMVSFQGNSILHNTVVNSGEVRLLGPFSSRNLQDRILCETDPCDPNPCLNDATCTPDHDCTCNCEEDGSCVCECTQHTPVYTCTCLDGFMGDNCEATACTSFPCQNGATCTPGGAQGYTCDCVEGYVGENCEQVIDPCDSNPCQNGATCTSGAQGYACTCLPGFEGFLCDQDRDECAAGTHDCDGHASCTNTHGSYTCACNSGFTGNGVTCTDINECISAGACGANASCTNTVGSFTCACLPGYTGDGQTCTIAAGSDSESSSSSSDSDSGSS